MFDIGGVLEVIDDAAFPGPWPARLGLTEAGCAERLEGLDGDPVVGEVPWPDVLRHWRDRLGLDEDSAHTLGARERERHHGFERILDELLRESRQPSLRNRGSVRFSGCRPCLSA